ncbi:MULTISPECIES: serine O-acetyltransferase [Methylobacterium]|uniref:serine O-acetyltransferase n=1 Tax=Methylobacterium TaxID=407 RepID=UPI0005B9AE51|nr:MULTISPECIES: serine O-acetyltransferase [Methylobacterium]AWV18163.1 serine O-acetyltransferase [Methylobacterium sp. XJLW]KOX53917.1 serine acetyltransferase [Streptomyces purpurogeneiscleroticus]MDH3032327.1 serine O-acetyltransferase [Methylobacterium fujisawaense]WFS09299.1 serine O-acetyltransferase [Methylobacterium sp. 391_Methyba4]
MHHAALPPAGATMAVVQPPLRVTSRGTAEAEVWAGLRAEAEAALIEEPLYAGIIQATILDQRSLAQAFAYRLAHRLGDGDLARLSMRDLCLSAFEADPQAGAHAVRDLVAIRERDPTCRRFLDPFLFYKGLAALEAYRVGHWLWHQGRATLALHVQSRISEVFGCDIHPAARIGSGVFIDHATGVVIGETAVIADDVSILQSVTLGGNGKESGDRHPKIERGVLLSVGAKVLGNIRVGAGAKVAAAAVVLQDVPPHTTVAGVPARVVSRLPVGEEPALSMDQSFGYGDGI